MRKLEKQMIDAIKNRRNWSGKNTMVISKLPHTSLGDWAVYLPGNRIAEAVGNVTDMDGNECVNIMFTLAGWPTVTTRSRLNALGRYISDAFGVDNPGISQSRNRQWFHDIDGSVREIGDREEVVMTIPCN